MTNKLEGKIAVITGGTEGSLSDCGGRSCTDRPCLGYGRSLM
jgi:hypothetical protein